MNSATGVNHELKIAQDEEKNYFLLSAYKDSSSKPSQAKTTNKVYKWTWDNLEKLIEGNK